MRRPIIGGLLHPPASKQDGEKSMDERDDLREVLHRLLKAIALSAPDARPELLWWCRFAGLVGVK